MSRRPGHPFGRKRRDQSHAFAFEFAFDSAFAGFRLPAEIIVFAVRRFLSYRHVDELLDEYGRSIT